MKKFIIIFFLIFIFLLSLYLISLLKKSDNIENKNQPGYGNWEKLTDNIYLEKDSIKKDKYSISGWFKMYSSEDNYSYNAKGIPTYYLLIKYEADCTSPALCLIHIKDFDKNNILITDEPNENDICYNGPGGWINGEIAYKALCKYEKDRE